MVRRRNSVIIPTFGLVDEGMRRHIARPLVATALNRAREAGARSVTTVTDKQHYQLFADLGFRTQFEVVTWVWHPVA